MRRLIVRPVASTTCDLDRAIIAGATPFEGPFAIGHECVISDRLPFDDAPAALAELPRKAVFVR
jgi:hypothetical protein